MLQKRRVAGLAGLGLGGWLRGLMAGREPGSLEVWGGVSSRFGVSPHHQRVLYSLRETMGGPKGVLKGSKFFL